MRYKVKALVRRKTAERFTLQTFVVHTAARVSSLAEILRLWQREYGPDWELDHVESWAADAPPSTTTDLESHDGNPDPQGTPEDRELGRR